MIAGLKGFEPLAYGLRVLKASNSENELKFSNFDVEEYLSFKTNGLSLRTSNVIKQIVWTFYDFSHGCLSKECALGFSQYILERYKSDTSINKFFIYTRHFVNFLAKTRNDPSIGSLLYYLEKPKKRREQKLLTPYIVVDADIRNTLDRIANCPTLNDATKTEYRAFFLLLAYSGQRVMTVCRLTVKQFRTALAKDPQVLVVESDQDKIRLAHEVPLHPVIIPLLMAMVHDRDDSELMFNYEPFMKWLRKHPVQLSRSEGRIQLKLARKYFEQKSDDLNMNQTYLKYITSHDVSGVQWTNYKQFLPENVYQRYMEAWRSVNLMEN
jgi:integrase